MLKLGVNIDHVATLREARYRGRGFGEPGPVEAARMCEAAGAHGITAHLREDRRHIQDRDVWELREKIETRLNLEMANAPVIVGIALEVRPAIVCIVPERRLEVTTEGGLDVLAAEKSLTETRKKMNDAGIVIPTDRYLGAHQIQLIGKRSLEIQRDDAQAFRTRGGVSLRVGGGGSGSLRNRGVLKDILIDVDANAGVFRDHFRQGRQSDRPFGG